MGDTELDPELVEQLDTMVDELRELTDDELSAVVDLLVQIRLRAGTS